MPVLSLSVCYIISRLGSQDGFSAFGAGPARDFCGRLFLLSMVDHIGKVIPRGDLPAILP